jgi:hypothetical protein
MYAQARRRGTSQPHGPAPGIKIFKENKMTTLPKAPLLQVLDQDGSVMLANIPGTNNPVAILDDRVLDLLFAQCRDARAEALKADGNVGAAFDLYRTLDGVLKSYMKIRNEYYDRIEIERERAEAELKLQGAINALKESQSHP